MLPIVETYEHKRDQSIMLVLHNPYNTELQNHVDWHTELHSNVGFRSVLTSLEILRDYALRLSGCVPLVWMARLSFCV